MKCKKSRLTKKDIKIIDKIMLIKTVKRTKKENNVINLIKL